MFCCCIVVGIKLALHLWQLLSLIEVAQDKGGHKVSKNKKTSREQNKKLDGQMWQIEWLVMWHVEVVLMCRYVCMSFLQSKHMYGMGCCYLSGKESVDRKREQRKIDKLGAKHES